LGVVSFNFAKDKWELYNLEQDFSEANDLSAKYPDKLKDLQDLFWIEAAKYNVLPLDDRTAERADPRLRPSLIAGRTKFTYFPGAVRIPESSSANVKNTSHTITAYIEMPEKSGDGVLVAAGGISGGYTLYIKEGKPIYEYNWFTQARYKVTSPEQIPPGPATIRLEFKYDGGGAGKGGLATLYVNDKKVGEGRIEKTIPARYSLDETFDVGMDTGSPVSADYESPFSFAGTLKKVDIDVAPANLSTSDREMLRQAAQDCEMAAE
jgi:hypothetical protein